MEPSHGNRSRHWNTRPRIYLACVLIGSIGAQMWTTGSSLEWDSGLYICKTIVEQHGENIKLKANGATIQVTAEVRAQATGVARPESTGVETIFHVILPGIPVPALSGETGHCKPTSISRTT